MTATDTSTTAEPAHGGWLATFRIDPLLMRLFVWSGLVLVAATIVGFGWLMHMVPPPSPSLNTQELLQHVQEHQTSILIGAALVTFSGPSG
jgi:phospholipase C